MGLSVNKEYKKIIAMTAVIGGVYLTMRFLVPLIIPFLVAFLIVTFMYPMISKLHNKTHIGRGFLASGFLLVFIIILMGIGFLLFGKLFYSVGDWIAQCDLLEDEISIFITNCCRELESDWGINAAVIEDFVLENVNIFIENLQVQVIPKLMGESFFYVKELAAAGAGIFVTVISVALLAKDYESIRAGLERQKGFRIAAEILGKIGNMLGIFVKAEGTIMLAISAICILGFWIIGIDNPFGFGIITGFLDLLPFIGTGIILIPFALFALLQGEIVKAVGFIVLYVICVVTREFLEPKLIGDKMGIYPIGILIAIYLGIKLFGLKGIILGPLSVLLIMEINKKLEF